MNEEYFKALEALSSKMKELVQTMEVLQKVLAETNEKILAIAKEMPLIDFEKLDKPAFLGYGKNYQPLVDDLDSYNPPQGLILNHH